MIDPTNGRWRRTARPRARRTATAIVGLTALAASIALPTAGQAGAWTPRPNPSSVPVCRTLVAMQQGRITSSATSEFQQASELMGDLAAVAPQPLQGELASLQSTFGAVMADASSGQSVLPAFQALTNSASLITTEQAVADNLTQLCGPSIAPPTTSNTTASSTIPDVCPGWTSQGNIYTNNEFPYLLDTSGANYWGFNSPVTPGGRIQIHGQYPYARYFSILPNDVNTNNLHQLTDVDIQPDPGSGNPFTGPLTAGQGRWYTVNFDFSPPPANPAPNTSYVGDTASGTPNPYVLFVYRIYESDLGATPNSAGVPLPAITYYNADGTVAKQFPECNPYPDGTPSAPTQIQSFPALPIPGPATSAHPSISLSSNYHLPVNLLANPDVQYMNAYYTHRYGKVFVVHAKAFTTPATPTQPVYTPGLDVRGWSICSYNFYAGFANGCSADHQVPVDADGYYTVVISTQADRPWNATVSHGVLWINWGPYLDGQVTWRLFLASSPLIQQLDAAITSGHPSPSIAPYVPQFAYCSPRVFDIGGWNLCHFFGQWARR